MSIYGGGNVEDSLFDGDLINETAEVADILIADELLRSLTESELKEFLESDECQQLLEARVLRKKTLVRLGKNDELHRRARLAALQMAISKNDPLAKLLAKVRIKEREYLNKIYAKYGVKGERVAKKAQKEYFKKVPILKAKGKVQDTISNVFNSRDKK